MFSGLAADKITMPIRQQAPTVLFAAGPLSLCEEGEGRAFYGRNVALVLSVIVSGNFQTESLKTGVSVLGVRKVEFQNWYFENWSFRTGNSKTGVSAPGTRKLEFPHRELENWSFRSGSSKTRGCKLRTTETLDAYVPCGV